MNPHSSNLTLAHLLSGIRARVAATPHVKRLALGGDVEIVEDELKELARLPLTEKTLAELQHLIDLIRDASLTMQDLAKAPSGRGSNESMNVGRWTPHGAWQRDVARHLEGVATEVARVCQHD